MNRSPHSINCPSLLAEKRDLESCPLFAFCAEHGELDVSMIGANRIPFICFILPPPKRVDTINFVSCLDYNNDEGFCQIFFDIN